MSSDEKISTCAVCQDLYDTPKILPKCGHTFCLKCLRAIWENSFDLSTITCPECRTVNLVNVAAGPEGLTTNYHARHSVDALKEPRPPSKVVEPMPFESIATCTHWPLMSPQATVTCRHCNLRFCDACLLGHKERLKLDIIWQGSDLEERLERVSQGLDVNIENLSNSIKDETIATEEQIIKSCQTFQNAVIAASAEHAGNLIRNLREISEFQLKRVGNAADNAKMQQISLSRSIVELNNKSVLHCSLDDLIAIYEKMKRQSSSGIAELESFKASQSPGKFSFDTSFAFDSAAILMRLTSPVSSKELAWQLADFQDVRSVEDTKERRLHATAKTGNKQLLKEILHRKGLPPACRKFMVEHGDMEDRNRTLLLQAAMNGHAEFVKSLVLEYDANVFAKDDKETMAIHLASERGHLDVVRFLTAFKSDLGEAKNNKNCTPLFVAVKNSHIPIVRFLVEQRCADLECRGGECGRTPLLEAVFQQNTEIVKYLLAKGADLKAKDVENDDTAAHIAVGCGNSELAKFLIDLNPTFLRQKNKQRQTPFKLAKAQKINKNMQFVVFFEHLKNL